MTNPDITVWTKLNCVQCTATKRRLTQRSVPYTEKSLDDNPDAIEQFRAAGLAQAPIVETPTRTWAGFRPDLIDKMAGYERTHRTASNSNHPVHGGNIPRRNN